MLSVAAGGAPLALKRLVAQQVGSRFPPRFFHVLLAILCPVLCTEGRKFPKTWGAGLRPFLPPCTWQQADVDTQGGPLEVGALFGEQCRLRTGGAGPMQRGGFLKVFRGFMRFFSFLSVSKKNRKYKLKTFPANPQGVLEPFVFLF